MARPYRDECRAAARSGEYSNSGDRARQPTDEHADHDEQAPVLGVKPFDAVHHIHRSGSHPDSLAPDAAATSTKTLSGARRSPCAAAITRDINAMQSFRQNMLAS